MEKNRFRTAALFSGLANGFFGAGGGVLAVMAFLIRKDDPQKAHASAVAAMLPASAVSGVLYCLWGALPQGGVLWPTIAGTVGGGLVGALLLGRIKGVWLARLFGVLVIASAIRMVFF